MIRNFLLILALFCCSFSCQQNASQVDAPEPEPLSVAEAIIQKLPPVEIHLTEITPAGLQAEIKKHQGKVVLVDFWALWCPMCLESFHHLSEWYLKYSEQGLVIITIDLDENNSDNRKFVTEYLTEQRAPFENFISTDGATQKAMRGFKIDGGALPHCQIYNRQGEHVISLGNVNPDQIYDEPSISAALEKQFSEK